MEVKDSSVLHQRCCAQGKKLPEGFEAADGDVTDEDESSEADKAKHGHKRVRIYSVAQ